jgi:hypothetical protein
MSKGAPKTAQIGVRNYGAFGGLLPDSMSTGSHCGGPLMEFGGFGEIENFRFFSKNSKSFGPLCHDKSLLAERLPGVFSDIFSTCGITVKIPSQIGGMERMDEWKKYFCGALSTGALDGTAGSDHLAVERSREKQAKEPKHQETWRRAMGAEMFMGTRFISESKGAPEVYPKDLRLEWWREGSYPDYTPIRTDTSEESGRTRDTDEDQEIEE